MEPRKVTHLCVVNLGLFRTGTTTLAKAFESLGWRVFREFPKLTAEEHRQFLVQPAELVREWWHTGREQVIKLLKDYNLICDGWISLLVFLPEQVLWKLQKDLRNEGVLVHFVATSRHVSAIVRSELQHWVVRDLERGLTINDRSRLEELLRLRALHHASCIQSLKRLTIHLLPLEQFQEWPTTLWKVTNHKSKVWQRAFQETGIQNANPTLPVQGILLTLRIGVGHEAEKSMNNVSSLLDSIEQDTLCRYLVVLGIDSDEAQGASAHAFEMLLTSRSRVKTVSVVLNPIQEPFRICDAWHRMAKKAWAEGADWVVLLGDDIEVDAPYHYRAFYRAFLDISERLQCPFGFGCPWWNDSSFPGFPTFPVVGKVHSQIFGGLIPENRLGAFVNQDLDPYLQRLYLKYGAAPLVAESRLTNHQGGNDASPARYKRVPVTGWRDWVLEDVSPIYQYLQKSSSLLKIPQFLLVDVVVPTFRLDLPFLVRICSLEVPENFRTTFIVIVDNPDELVRLSTKLGSPTSDPNQAAFVLEQHLVSSSKASHNSKRGNNVRVRCNAKNLGASASRNLGLDESAAEYVLFLDDDVVPDPDLLASYAASLDLHIAGGGCEIVGLVGLVQFPRHPDLPLRHAAVLMSYLTFMFEIADNPLYTRPAWGVTANILVKRLRVRFDTAYAKTGGGEDVDFCLRLTQETSGYLVACPSAIVHHPFWQGSPLALSKHFFNWATGDSALFKRFPEHCYHSWPNAVETLAFLVPIQVAIGSGVVLTLVTVLLFLLADVAVDMADGPNYRNRCSLLKYERGYWFYAAAHLLANAYVIILETGRLWGHLKRGEIQNLIRRFDWHCGRLENSRRNFQCHERDKFFCFCSITVVVLAFGYA